MSPLPGWQLSLLHFSPELPASIWAVFLFAPCLQNRKLPDLREHVTFSTALIKTKWLKIPLLFTISSIRICKHCKLLDNYIDKCKQNIPWEHDTALSVYLCILNWASARLYHPVFRLNFFNPNKKRRWIIGREVSIGRSCHFVDFWELGSKIHSFLKTKLTLL